MNRLWLKGGRRINSHESSFLHVSSERGGKTSRTLLVGTAKIRQAITNISDNIIDNGTETIQNKAENSLTQRELEILSQIVAGKNNQEIAEELQIAIGTVRVHVHAILQKLEVRDRTQAAILAIEKGLIDLWQKS